MNKEYYFKLRNDSKVKVEKVVFDAWLHKTLGDFVVITTPNDNNLYIMKEEILLGFDLNKNKYNAKKQYKEK